MKLDSWAVAAAILLKANHSINYNDLTQTVIASELTTLGLKGTTPERTLRTILANKKVKGRPVFEAYGEGYYTVSDRSFVESLSKVRMALREIDR